MTSRVEAMVGCSGLLTGTSGRVRVNPSRVAGTTGKGRAGTRINGRGYNG